VNFSSGALADFEGLLGSSARKTVRWTVFSENGLASPGEKSKSLQETTEGKGTARCAAVLCGISLRNDCAMRRLQFRSCGRKICGGPCDAATTPHQKAYCIVKEVHPVSDITLASRVRRFADRLYREDVNLHGFMFSANGALVAKAYYAPFSEGQPHRMYSISKTMTGLAIGLLAEDGKLGLDQRVAEFFPDWMPAEPSPWLSGLTLRDMLRMSTCYPNATYSEARDDCWAKTFFTAVPTHAPGTVFHYDTSCSQVLAELVRRLSGEQVLDFLDRRVFRPLGATDEKYWLRDPSGCCQGGTGLCMSLRDLHKVSQCLLDGGRGIVPAWYVRQMGQKHIDTLMRGNPEERYGYGWQCWRTRAGWSMYGLGGQLAVVCPEQGALLTTIADTGLDGYDVQRIYDAFFEEIYPFLDATPGDVLDLRLENKPLPHNPDCATAPGGEYRFPAGNDLGLIWLNLKGNRLCYENARGAAEIDFVPGEDVTGEFPGWPGEPAVIKSGWVAPGLLRLRCHAIGDAPCGFEMLLCFAGDAVTVQARRSYNALTDDYNGVTTGTAMTANF